MSSIAIGHEDPLEGLDRIDWAELEHAYGEAEDVPGLLRTLRSADAKAREAAHRELSATIFHQGSRYEATPHAVPFLIRLAAAPDTPDRDQVLRLLARIAIGYDQSRLPWGVNPAEWRTEVAELQATGAEGMRRQLDAWVEAAPDDAERNRRDWQRTCYDFDRHLSEAVCGLASYDAVRAGVPALCGLLEDPDPAVRAAAAHLLGWFPEEADTALPRLLRATGREPNAIVSVGLLGGPPHIDHLRPYLEAQDPTTRCAAALALIRLGVTEPRVVMELAAAPAKGLLFLSGDLRGYAWLSLAARHDRVGVEAVDTVLSTMSRMDDLGTFTVVAAVLQLVFGRPADPLPPFPELTVRQRRAVRILADLDPRLWRWVNFTEVIRYWNLPDDLEELRAYAELPAAR
ncbi:HEAT repeat domain-containing protein [Thermomonospora cellulosilytica]|uniref:HEAT repeat protein n=1 Tax=Thermomonospora cellulosilytica TaxID=1411118 RepID=A0A7W3N515_9ACTN|nr:HEAT repeat domain-containing protein [Thermomonospora cellulosilytica]MBA9007689.1 HEAT repeat protein [Thermomonospora cellulosilytica]